MNNNQTQKKVCLPIGKLCEDGYCGECLFLNLSRPGVSGMRYYCVKTDSFKAPSEHSKYLCGSFTRR